MGEGHRQGGGFKQRSRELKGEGEGFIKRESGGLRGFPVFLKHNLFKKN